MEKKIKIAVPAIHANLDENKRFKSELQEAFSGAEEVYLDFQNLAAISSITLGCIMFGMRDHRTKIRFINTSDYLMDSLRTIIGKMVEEFVVGPVKKLEIETFKSPSSR